MKLKKVTESPQPLGITKKEFLKTGLKISHVAQILGYSRADGLACLFERGASRQRRTDIQLALCAVADEIRRLAERIR